MGFFGAAHGGGVGGQKGPPSLRSVTHTLQWSNLVHLYLYLTLILIPKEDSKNI